ncbi:MAG TPA: universal stress protein [bacterium]|nr:universal stress protein [bacterium]
MPIRTILVPTDFSDSADAALRWARELAQAFGAKIILLHVIDLPYQWMPVAGPAAVPAPIPATVVRAIREQAGASLTALAERTPEVRRQILRAGHARDVILSTADDVSADVIVMGTHGRRGVSHLFVGSVAEHVVRYSRIPVSTVRAPRRGTRR